MDQIKILLSPVSYLIFIEINIVASFEFFEFKIMYQKNDLLINKLMGICSSKKSDKEAGIQLQIEKTVAEQKKLKIEEELQVQHSTRRSICNQFSTLNTNGNAITLHQAEQDVQENQDGEPQQPQQSQQAKASKKKPRSTKDDVNYYRRSDHVLKAFSLVVELTQNEQKKYYNITIGTKIKDCVHYAHVNGILITQNDFELFNLQPDTFKEANKYSRIPTFFSTDNYFNIDKESPNSFISFDKLLNVERKIALKQTHVRSKKKQSIIQEQHLNQQKEADFILTSNLEMLEIITVVDIEQQSRFLNVLFHMILQHYHQNLDQYLVFIINTTFLFDIPPQFDQPNMYRLALFYDSLSYSLKDLQQILLNDKSELSSFLHKKLSLNLIEILINCYEKYLYRLNFTLSTIFYVPKYKSFKLESFGRMKTLIEFGQNPEVVLKTLEEKKYKTFAKSFKKDLFAITDIIIYFKRVQNQNLRSITTTRKKYFVNMKKNHLENLEDEKNYCLLAEKLFCHDQDRYLLEFLKMAIYSYENTDVDKLIQDIKQVTNSLQKELNDVDFQQDSKQFDQQDQNQEQQKLSNSNSVDLDDLSEVKQMESFPVNICEDYKSIALNKDKLSEVDQTYLEIIYQSLLYNNRFQAYYEKFQNLQKPIFQNCYVEILNIFYFIRQIPDDSWQEKLKMVSQKMDKVIDIIKTIKDDSVDNFHITLLFQIMTLSQKKPFVILNQLSKCISNQLKQKMQMDHRLRSQNQAKGLLEQKKHVMLQVWSALSYLNSDNYFQAISKIQKAIGFQLKNQHQASLSYGYSLLVSGEIARISLAPISAMLNLEMSLVIYNQFFPEFKSIEDQQDLQDKSEYNPFQIRYKDIKVKNLATSNKAKVEFLLGMSYFDIHDQENSLLCLKRAQELMLRSFHIYAEEVVFLVLQQLWIHVLQDDIGHAMNIALFYANDMNQQYRNGREFKKKIISKLQFIIGSIFEFNGQYLSAIRFIERSNRTLTKAKGNNFVIQMHYQAKKIQIISKLKEAFFKIKSKQQVRCEQDLSLFQTLNEALGQTFQTLYFKQPITLKTSVLLNKVGKQIIHIQGLMRTDGQTKAIKLLGELIKALNKSKKDEIYGLVQDKYLILSLDKMNPKEIEGQIHSIIEIHDRYLQFPLKQNHVLKCQLILLCVFLKQKNTNQIFDHFKNIEQTIDEFQNILQWKSLSSNNNDISVQNKFETIVRKGKIAMVYQIANVTELIELFNKFKKKIFENLQNRDKFVDIANLFQKKIINCQAFLKLLETKQECLLGSYSQVKIINEGEQELQQSEPVVTIQRENTQQLKVIEQSTEIDTKDNQKLVFDLRSIEELMVEKKLAHHRKGKTQEAIQKIEEKNEHEKMNKSHKRNETEITVNNATKKKKIEYKINPFQSTMKKQQKLQ
ncbi:unnamed protein product [Paramecium pentaurelia]|uniref:Uncharacterized protein n=1 Tax=Paramecium pentaurelia TaxID=43138 RepID=A0A8S1RVY5_9CILI|nr:unnamed protein product [Paramecium pentaurelia]